MSELKGSPLIHFVSDLMRFTFYAFGGPLSQSSAFECALHIPKVTPRV